MKPCHATHPLDRPELAAMVPWDGKSCRVCYLYEHDDGYRRLWGGDGPPPGTVATNTLPIPAVCRWEGEVLEYAPCACEGKHVRRCLSDDPESPDDGHCTRATLGGTVRGCDQCPCRDRPAPPPAGTRPGIVLGTYGWPGLIDFQIRMIRRNCGPVPILIADDASPAGAAIEDLADSHEGVEAWVSAMRAGHYKGDATVFWKGLQWARRRGLTHLCKLSYRFVHLEPDWLAKAVGVLRKSGEATLMQDCLDQHKLFVRSECMLFDVARWGPLWQEFLPPDRAAGFVNPTELHVWHLVFTHQQGRYCRWPGMTVNRNEYTPGTLWHCSSHRSDYDHWAKVVGAKLDDDFTVVGGPMLKDWKQG